MKPITEKSIGSISYEWDQIAPNRAKLIGDGLDISFSKVLVPGILRAIDYCDMTSVIDCGCGTGELTCILSEVSSTIKGIDISKKSIDLAMRLSKCNDSKAEFINTSIEEFAKLNPSSVTTCIANMVLTNITDLPNSIKAIKSMIKPGGNFVFTITHPCYWPIYWNYWNEPWFNYQQEIIIESDFSITRCKAIGISTHIHRPFSQYIEALLMNDMSICSIEELYPEYPIDDYDYPYPRFICFRCMK